jgi:elongation factor G
VSESKTHSRPIISAVISPKSDDDRRSFQRALSDLAQRNPTIRIGTESIAGQTIISGMDELHLEAICDRIVHKYKVQLNVGKAKVIYLETIRKSSEAEGKYVRFMSRHCMYGHVRLRLEPLEAGTGYQFVNEISEGTVPLEFVEPINLGIQAAMKGGILAGYEMIDVRAVLYDGSYHVGDSNEMAFKIAASMAFKEAARKANPVILEPVMSIEVVTPEDFAGGIMADLSLRRGRIEGTEHRAGSLVITAIAPLAEMIGYAMDMRSITQGRAEYSMHFAYYEAAPCTGDSGADEAGATASGPKGPKAGSGFAAAKLDPKSE